MRALALCLALLAGCAAPSFDHPTKNHDDYNRDSAECEPSAGIHVLGWVPVLGIVVNPEAQFASCMAERGWRQRSRF